MGLRCLPQMDIPQDRFSGQSGVARRLFCCGWGGAEGMGFEFCNFCR